MYDHELHDYLSNRGNSITADEYLHVCYTCPQINHVKYSASGDYFEAWSDSGTYFKFQVNYSKGD